MKLEAGRFRWNGAHPERAVWDVDSAPGDHGRVLHGLAWSVAAAVRAVTVVFNLDIHRNTFTILQDQRHAGANMLKLFDVSCPSAVPEPQSSEELFLHVWRRR